MSPVLSTISHMTHYRAGILTSNLEKDDEGDGGRRPRHGARAAFKPGRSDNEGSLWLLGEEFSEV